MSTKQKQIKINTPISWPTWCLALVVAAFVTKSNNQTQFQRDYSVFHRYQL